MKNIEPVEFNCSITLIIRGQKGLEKVFRMKFFKEINFFNNTSKRQFCFFFPKYHEEVNKFDRGG